MKRTLIGLALIGVATAWAQPTLNERMAARAQAGQGGDEGQAEHDGSGDIFAQAQPALQRLGRRPLRQPQRARGAGR